MITLCRGIHVEHIQSTKFRVSLLLWSWQCFAVTPGGTFRCRHVECRCTFGCSMEQGNSDISDRESVTTPKRRMLIGWLRSLAIWHRASSLPWSNHVSLRTFAYIMMKAVKSRWKPPGKGWMYNTPSFYWSMDWQSLTGTSHCLVTSTLMVCSLPNCTHNFPSCTWPQHLLKFPKSRFVKR